MNLLKKLFYSILFLILSLVVIAFLAARFVNPNEYKDKIQTLVQQKTGRALSIQGNIELAFFPWIGVRAHNIHFANAPGFQPNDFASLSEMDVRVKVLPLISKQVEVDQVTLKGLILNLGKNKQGVSNWQDLVSHSKTVVAAQKDSTSTTQKLAGLAFSIKGIEIEAGRITWLDAQKEQTMTFKNIQLKTSHPMPGEIFPINLDMDIERNKTQLKEHLSFKSDVLFTAQKAKLEKLALTFTEGTTTYALNIPSWIVDKETQTMQIPTALFAQGDLKATLHLTAVHVLNEPTFSGQIQIAPFNLKAVLTSAGKNRTTADPTALQKVALQSEFTGTLDTLILKPFILTVDDSHLTGNVQITHFKTKSMSSDLKMDQIDINRYLPPNAKNGDHHLNISQLSTRITYNQGLLNIDPLIATLYKGTLNGKITADTRSSVPKYTIDGHISQADMTELVTSGRLTGKADLKTHLASQGTDKPSILQNLNGDIQFSIQNGALLGANIPYQVERAVALFKRQPLPQEPQKNQTDFDALKGTGHIQNGVFSNNDLLVISSQFKVTGQGAVNLISQALNYRLKFVGLHRVQNSTTGQSILEERQTPIPIAITGTFDKPLVTPDVQAFLESEAGQKVMEKIKEKIQENIGNKRIGGVLQQLLQKQ